MTEELISMVKREESLVLHAYKDVAGWPTIGYGHRVPDMKHPSIDLETANELLAADLAHAEAEALELSPVLRKFPRRLAAVTDFIFNLGAGAYRSSTLRTRVDAEQWVAAGFEMRRWVHARVNGQMLVLPGLKHRRAIAAKWLVDG